MNRKAKGSAYKMKGYSYPGTSPMKQTDPPVGGEVFSTEGYIEKGEQYKKVKKSKRRNLATDLSARYNTTITKKTDPKTGRLTEKWDAKTIAAGMKSMAQVTNGDLFEIPLYDSGDIQADIRDDVDYGDDIDSKSEPASTSPNIPPGKKFINSKKGRKSRK